MLRKAVSLALVFLLSGGLYPQAKKPTLKEQALEIPLGSLIEARLQNKEKLRGRMGEITDDGFRLQHARANKVETRNIAFAELKSIKMVERESSGGRIALYVLAGVGVTFLILFAIAAAIVGD